jgi:TonB family protein
MKFKFLILYALLFFCYTQSFGQGQKNEAFYKNTGERVLKLKDADYRRVITEATDGMPGFDVAEYYANNTLKFKGRSDDINYPKLEGIGTSYFPNGAKREVANYKDGQFDGDDYHYYPNGMLYMHKKYEADPSNPATFGYRFLIVECRDSLGKVLVSNGNGYFVGYDQELKDNAEEGPIKDGFKDGAWHGQAGKNTSFVEEYKAGVLQKGKFTDEKSNSYDYTERQQQPRFPGGITGFSKFLSENLKYPKRAKSKGIEGLVIIGFIADTDGSLTDFKVIQSPDDDFSDEAIRVLKLSPPWEPAKFYGKITSLHFTVPINFLL